MFWWITSRSFLGFGMILALMGGILQERLLMALGAGIFVVSMILVEVTDSD